MKRIDARGLSCPQPVVLAHQAIKENPDSFEIIVDSEVSKENVCRLVHNNNFKTSVREEGTEYIIAVSKS